MNNKTILLVEDNPSDIALTRRALEKNRINNALAIAEDGEEALDYLLGADAGSRELPSLVLLDINLPKVDGLTVLKHIRGHARTQRLPVVILSSSTEEQDLATSYDNGANSYIRKPVNFEQFVLAVEQLGLYWLALNEQPPKVALP